MKGQDEGVTWLGSAVGWDWLGLEWHTLCDGLLKPRRLRILAGLDWTGGLFFPFPFSSFFSLIFLIFGVSTGLRPWADRVRAKPMGTNMN